MYSGTLPTSAVKSVMSGIKGALDFTRSKHAALIASVADMFFNGAPAETIVMVLLDNARKSIGDDGEELPVQPILQEAFSIAYNRVKEEKLLPDLNAFRNQIQRTSEQMITIAGKLDIPAPTELVAQPKSMRGEQGVSASVRHQQGEVLRQALGTNPSGPGVLGGDWNDGDSTVR